MSRELIVKPLGLVTRPNVYGQYPAGALSLAQNLVMRAPGILEAAPATVLGLSFGSANHQVMHMQPLEGGAMMTWTNNAGVWTVRRDAAAYSNPANVAAAPTYSATGFAPSFTSRGRVFINTIESGLLVVDDTTAAGTLRVAGLPQPQIRGVTGLNDGGPALPSHYVAGYSAVFRRKFSDGYEIASEPAPIYQLYNSGGTTMNFLIDVYCPASAGLQVGDIVELYKTNVIPGTAMPGTSGTSVTDPGPTLQMVASVVLTSSDISTAHINIRDASQPNELGVIDGKALYTNPGQEGALGANKRPPISKCCALFKNYAFYGNTTDPPLWTFNVPSGISAARPGDYPLFDTDSWRTYGVGLRRVLGTVTVGTNTITGISASHILGLKVGQLVVNAGLGATFAANTKITAVGATSITISLNATASGTGCDVEDVVELDGSEFVATFSPKNFLFTLSSQQSVAARWLYYQVNTSETLLEGQDPTTGFPKVDFIISPSQPNRINSTNTMTVRATNGSNYSPPTPEIVSSVQTISSTARPNLLCWSKDSQPEHVPVSNVTQVGNGEIIALEPTRDALWIFCTDGLYRLSGAGGVWRVDPVDTTLVLSSPRASCVLRDVVYCYTNQGFGRVTDAGFEPLSERIVGNLLPGAEYTETAAIIVERNEAEEEILIRLDATQVYVYNARENAYTVLLEPDVTCMAYVRYPVSGAACLAFGRSPSGQAPRYELWNSTANWLAGTARFQPVFAGDPFSAKQWIDGTFVFDASAAGASLTPNWNGTNQAAGLLANAGRYYNEARATFGVPRAAGLGHTLAPGFSFGALGFAPKFLALSLRYRQFGEQNLKR